MSDSDFTTTDTNDDVVDELEELRIKGAEVVASMRALTDWLETRPIIAAKLNYTLRNLNAFPYSDAEWQATLREAGSFEKRSDYGYLTARLRPVEGVLLDISRNKESTCQKVQVGEKIVDVEVPVDPDVVIETRIEQRVEPVYEWVCPDSWLTND